MGDLLWSLKNGDIDLVKAAIDEPGFDVNSEIGGRMPIHYAADYGQLDVIKVLLAKGADVNKADKHGISAVLAAIWEGHTECVKYLLEKCHPTTLHQQQTIQDSSLGPPSTYNTCELHIFVFLQYSACGNHFICESTCKSVL
uniref:Uncharacterized protein n=1 Tax=Branchiostoma floridae TaxID=7739 RepID=C3Z8Y7_BRAFL|eukprot:XP_002595008.1 hypothetical protein BRAFLDRAFT_128977 [Branchiostoma floridae]